MSDDETEADWNVRTVWALLAAAGLSPPDDEVERLAGLYPGLRRTADRFHAIDAGDAVQAAVLRAGVPATASRDDER